MAWAWTETLAVSTEDRPKIPPVQSFKPPVGAKVREDPRRPHDASKPGGRNEADRWVKFAAAAFQQAGIRRGDADQLAFEDGLGNFDETPARVWTVPTRKVAVHGQFSWAAEGAWNLVFGIQDLLGPSAAIRIAVERFIATTNIEVQGYPRNCGAKPEMLQVMRCASPGEQRVIFAPCRCLCGGNELTRLPFRDVLAVRSAAFVDRAACNIFYSLRVVSSDGVRLAYKTASGSVAISRWMRQLVGGDTHMPGYSPPNMLCALREDPTLPASDRVPTFPIAAEELGESTAKLQHPVPALQDVLPFMWAAAQVALVSILRRWHSDTIQDLIQARHPSPRCVRGVTQATTGMRKDENRAVAAAFVIFAGLAVDLVTEAATHMAQAQVLALASADPVSRLPLRCWRGVARGSINIQITDADIHGYCGASFPANVINDWVVLVAAAATGTGERMQQQAGKGVCERRATVPQGGAAPAPARHAQGRHRHRRLQTSSDHGLGRTLVRVLAVAAQRAYAASLLELPPAEALCNGHASCPAKQFAGRRRRPHWRRKRRQTYPELDSGRRLLRKGRLQARSSSCRCMLNRVLPDQFRLCTSSSQTPDQRASAEPRAGPPVAAEQDAGEPTAVDGWKQ
ncbi:PKAR, partial [Symbiodinium sp. KB8]